VKILRLLSKKLRRGVYFSAASFDCRIGRASGLLAAGESLLGGSFAIALEARDRTAQHPFQLTQQISFSSVSLSF
jgi:hypothetical protein